MQIKTIPLNSCNFKFTFKNAVWETVSVPIFQFLGHTGATHEHQYRNYPFRAQINITDSDRDPVQTS